MTPENNGPPRAVEVLPRLDVPGREDVLRLAEEAATADGVAALSEQSLLELRSPVRAVRHLLVRDDAGRAAGYAQLDLEGAPPSAELVVHPGLRGRGIGGALLAQLRELAPGVAVWAHGNLPAAQALARSVGMVVTRELWEMAVDLPDTETEIPAPQPPRDVLVRTFVPGADDAAWVRLNARAFADHPEQGRMSVADLRARRQEDWFDPTLLWLAEPTGGPGEGETGEGKPPALAASMWVKVVPGESSGEIYALGVHPDHQGRGLGRVLTDVALREMSRRGLTRATLYVEGDNAPAIRTYRAAGFERVGLDVQYR